MSESKNGFLTAEEVMDILQVKQSKAYGEWCSDTPILPGKESRRRNVDSKPNGKLVSVAKLRSSRFKAKTIF